MPLAEHLYELRDRLLISLAVIVVTSVFAFIWYAQSFGPIESLGELLRRPYCQLPPELRVDLTRTGDCRLLALGPFDQFKLRLQVALTVGVVLACPIWLYQFWQFITPAMKKKERRYGRFYVFGGTALFFAGAVVAYLVINQALAFLAGIGSEVQIQAMSGDSYFTFMLQLLLIFGVSFELPLLIISLNLVGVLTYEKLKAWRRGIIFGLFVFAAVATPGGDPFSMLALATGLCILFELSVQFTRIYDKRRGRNRPDWLNTPDDEAAPLDGGDAPGPSAAPAASDLGVPEPIDPAAPLGPGRRRESVRDAGAFDEIL